RGAISLSQTFSNGKTVTMRPCGSPAKPSVALLVNGTRFLLRQTFSPGRSVPNERLKNTKTGSHLIPTTLTPGLGSRVNVNGRAGQAAHAPRLNTRLRTIQKMTLPSNSNPCRV